MQLLVLICKQWTGRLWGHAVLTFGLKRRLVFLLSVINNVIEPSEVCKQVIISPAVGKRKLTAFMWAASNGQREIVERLLRAGASINLPNSQVSIESMLYSEKQKR